MFDNLKIKTLLIILGIILFTNSIICLTGTQIIETADNYRTSKWTCNTWNARPANSNNFWDKTKEDGGKDWRYPFFPEGEPIGPDPDGSGPQVAPTATGQYTGIAYGWGRVINYQLKIVNYQLRDVLIEN